ncbi:uncharacterized protein At4g14100 [Oryza sativa Japonica Group]|jgi:hypothetical protein|uniref:Os08g0102800 protein n=2 Tax=Oryza sativa subsp. japonica TaxID=39947 RepID=A3BNT7_ORYSJ|nr:uncharacterized protein At4g14100 [Oryza sativa Japonica Group]EAZ41226.1 hypothetical protein OsJ_25731 [Oryza sativa Japonica Group]KAF2917698.1 hypothetical protein DAI22_08g002200 [Oryza sativa Japonica Group]BAD33164.1 unknown protein [Oryza sativa Japonica Group]BAF22682.1 Os08g0102800 [Oryza sativa Japonica Group]BAG99981.1 unnamed protein product [Oryza sativa Japonica Group]|eukprot:NP_001060768.1 Os08g0102800 [Oryza sativa Japonica Group]
MAPTLPSWWLLFLLLLGVGATAAARGSKKLTPPVSTAYEWPERFHAVVVSINLTNHDRGGGRLQLIEIYYDWPHGRDLNIVRDQLSGDPPLYNVEWVNGTSYLFDTAASSCRTFQFPVGILPRSGVTPWTPTSPLAAPSAGYSTAIRGMCSCSKPV